MGCNGMKLPYLRCWDNTPIKIYITDGISESGSPNVIATYDGKCNFNEKARTIRDSDGQLIQLTASLTVGKDIAPDAKVLTGYVEYRGKEWKIHTGTRPSNPDGSVNHTKLELM